MIKRTQEHILCPFDHFLFAQGGFGEKSVSILIEEAFSPIFVHVSSTIGHKFTSNQLLNLSLYDMCYSSVSA